MLSEINVSAKANSDMSAMDMALGVNDAFGLTGDFQATVMDVAQYIR